MAAPASARAIPLATLVVIAAALVGMRVCERWGGSEQARVHPAADARAPTGDAAAQRARSDGGISLAQTPSPPAEPEGADATEPADNDASLAAAPHLLHGDARRTHRSNATGPTRAKLRWTTPVGGPVEAQVVASPDERTLYVASLGGSLTALDAETGASAWALPLGDRVYSTPCVAPNGTIYVGSDAHLFYAISAKGTVAWKLETAGDADTGALFVGNLVVFAAGPSVYAVRPGGDVAWRFDAKKKVYTAPALSAEPALDGGREGEKPIIVIGSQDHHVYALTALGALEWSVDLGADVDGAPVVGDDGAITVGTDGGELVRLSASGEVQWKVQVGGYVRGPLSVARNGDALAGVYGPTPRVVRVGVDGGVEASFALPGSGARELGVQGGPLEDATGALFFGAQDDDVHALGPEDAWEWSFATGGDVDAPLTLLSSGALVAASDDGNIYLFDP